MLAVPKLCHCLKDTTIYEDSVHYCNFVQAGLPAGNGNFGHRARGYIITSDGRKHPKVRGRNNIVVFIASLAGLLALLGLLTFLIARNSGGTAGADGGIEEGTGATSPRDHSPLDAPQAKFLSIFASNADGSLASYMVGGKTEEFDAFAADVASAPPAEGVSDESFSDLLVFSFGPGDTLEVAYSRGRNQFILGDRLFQPAENLAPMIANVEQKFNQ